MSSVESNSPSGMRHRPSSRNGSVQISLGRDSVSSASNIVSTPSTSTPPTSPTHSNRHSFFNSRTLAYQKTYRARRLGSRGTRYYLLWGLSLFSLALAWAIGRSDAHPAMLGLLVVAMVILWWDQGRRILDSVEKQTEMRVRRRRTVQHSESAEWVNLALNRWWSTCSDSMLEILKDYIEPLLCEVAPPGVESVELVECDLSDQTPMISNLQLFDLPPTTGSTHNSSPYQSYVDLTSQSQRTIIANLDFTLPAPDSQIVIRARLGGKKVGYNTLIYVEGLHISGPVQAAVIIDRDIPFPHVSQVTATFCRKPDIWFSVRVLKALKVMEMPVLKNWIHSFIMDMFTSLLVDPGRLTVNLVPGGPLDEVTAASEPVKMACGVLTVTVHSSLPDQKTKKKGTKVVSMLVVKQRKFIYKSSKDLGDSRRWLTLTLGKQKRKKQLPLRRETWSVNYSFLVYDLKQDVLVTKVKLYRVVNSQVLATHSIALDSLNLVDEKGAAKTIVRTRTFSNPETNLSLDFKFYPLPQVSLILPKEITPKYTEVAGVLYVHIHSASGLLSADSDGLSDPYCLVLANKKKVMTTHYELDSLSPQWEKGVEFFVTDFTQVTLTFVVYDWDGPLIGDDLLGVAKLALSHDCPEVIRKRLELSIDGVNIKNDQSLGSIMVSAVFRPVGAVATSELEVQRSAIDAGSHDNSGIVTAEGAEPANVPSVVSRVSGDTKSAVKESGRYVGRHVVPLASRQLKRVAKLLRTQRQRRTSTGEGMMEVTVFRGKNLVPKDSNGLSDPYIVIKYGSDTMFRTHVIEKCLNPEWNESVSLVAPSHDDIIKVECWDKDRFSDDFMGSIQFTEQDLVKFEEGPKWFRLQHVKTGEILLVMKKISGAEEELEWSHLDEASRPLHLVGEIPLVDHANGGGTPGRIVRRASLSTMSSEDGSIARIREEEEERSNSESDLSNVVPQSSASGSTHSFSPTAKSNANSATEYTTSKHSSLTRRNTLGHFPDRDKRSLTLTGRSYDDNTEPAQRPKYPETKADIERALKGSSDTSSTMERSSTRSKLPSMYYNVSGQVIDASGLRGELDHLELYIKVRLNTRPTYQRQQKFGRGPVIHKTRVLRGSSNPQWKEDFMVKESPVPSDSLLTVDLKSGSKINIGTNGVTLDKFFEGNLKATKSLDLGNNAKLRIRLTRQPTPQPSPLTRHKVTASQS